MIKIDDVIPKPRLSKRWRDRVLTFAPLGFALLIAAVISFSAYYHFYKDPGNINGIWVEVHGALLEVFILSILLERYNKERENLDYKQPRRLAFARLHDITYRGIQELGYESEGKRYVYFGGRMCISRTFSLSSVREGVERELLLLSVNGESSVSGLARKWSLIAEEVRDSLASTCLLTLHLLDPELMALIFEADSSLALFADQTRQDSFSVGDTVEEQVSELTRLRFSVLSSLKELLKALEDRADCIESREEHLLRVKQSIEKLRRENEALGRPTKGLKRIPDGAA